MATDRALEGPPDRAYRMFVESMRDGVATVSEAGIVLYANRSLTELLSRPLSQIIGAPMASFVGHGYHAGLAAQSAGAGGGSTIEIELIGSEGEVIPVRAGGWTLVQDFERLICLSFAELPGLRREQEQLALASKKARDASHLKSEFVANISHELRTPLNGVIGMSGLLLETALTAEQREYADAVRTSGDVLLSAIEEILDFSIIEAGELELKAAPLRLRAVVEEVCSLVAPLAHAKGVEVLSDVSDGLPATIIGDSSRLRQVLTNLMTNAVKFTAAGAVSAHVTQQLGYGGLRVRFEVKDSGIGIAPTTKDGIFEPFVQGDGSTTRRYGGTGLGLAICEHLIELMDGEIGVESVEGDGSTFWFTLPLREVASEAEAEPLYAGVRVLVVDDNAMSRDLLGLQLVAWEMTCDLAADGETALEMLHAAEKQGLPYTMVLLDAGMPGTDDLELIPLIRSCSPALRVPILMLTSSRGEREDGKRAGADGLLTKPIGRQRLHDGVAQILSFVRSDKLRDDPGPTEPFDDGHAHSGSLVLLAEDNEVNRLVAVRMLEKRGFLVDVATNGREALEMCRRRRYKAIFMDCQMPELDGYETTRELRRRETTGRRRVPIIALTASTMKGDREKCLTAGMDDYVGKPIGAQALDLAIARSLAPNPGFPAA